MPPSTQRPEPPYRQIVAEIRARILADELLRSGRFPLPATVIGEGVPDVNGLFECSLARPLDGFAALVEDQARTRP